MRAFARENVHPSVKFVTRDGQAYRWKRFDGRRYSEILLKSDIQQQTRLTQDEIVHHEFRHFYAISP